MMHRGQSLIELIIAIGAIGTILVAIVATATRSISIQTFSRVQAQATKLADEQVERVRSFRDQNGLSDLTCSSRCAISQNTPPLVIGPTMGAGEMDVWFEVVAPGTCPTPPAGISQMKEITAIAEWSDAKGAHRSRLVTCLSDRSDWTQ